MPDLIVSATLPRWWNVSPNELHAVALYQRSGEELLTASVKIPQLRAKVVEILADRMAPQRLERIAAGSPARRRPRCHASSPDARRHLLPRRSVPHKISRTKPPPAGPAGRQLEDLARQHPDEVSLERISKDFGVPHPTLARTYGRELLNVKPFPFFGGYSSRLFGESWESSNLYWARLADEMGYSPVMLNRLVPELTRHMTAKIFATDLEDWPAMLRAMRRDRRRVPPGQDRLFARRHHTALRQDQPARAAIHATGELI